MKITPSIRAFTAITCLTIFVSCEQDQVEEETVPVPVNEAPIMLDQSFDVLESARPFEVVGAIEARDPEGEDLLFSLETDVDLLVNPVTGVITNKGTTIFDYETATVLIIQVSARDKKGATTRATITFNVVDVEDGPLTNYQKSFVDEYIYLTYKLSPTASGGSLSEKWRQPIKLYMDGDLPDNFLQTVEGYLNEFRALMQEGTTIELVNSQQESNVHAVLGPTGAIANLWPDMFSLINNQGFGGYALYNSDGDFSIFNGRIWLGSTDEGLFKHELGHIIGLGHTSDAYCEDQVTSVMCSGAADEFNLFDREIIKILYDPNTPVGLNQIEMRELVTQLLINGEVSI